MKRVHDRLATDALADIPRCRQPLTWAAVVACVCMVAAWASGVRADGATTPAQQQVLAAERAFARSMADRDAAAFARYVADEAVFFGGAGTLRGKSQVVAGWAKFFEGATAPFSWEPDQVEVLPSGSLALSTGLVRDPQGKVIARFNSIWRLESPGQWRVVFDKGSPPDPKDLG
jgi:ketosteroid isomerase-like protein